MRQPNKRYLLPFAKGTLPAELVLKNASVVDVFTESVFTADIAIQDGWIVGVGSYNGRREIDLSGRFVAPGLIDAHMHIESSMRSPSLLARLVLPHGTTTLIADPHEIVNVAGADGMRYMLEESESAPANIFFMLPSSVPSDGLLNNGGVFGLDEMKAFLHHPRVIGLGEVMDCSAVVDNNPEIIKKIGMMVNRPIDGHAPALTGKPLQAYRLAGIQTDHECETFEEAFERLKAGFIVHIREGTAAKNARPILEGALQTGISLDRFVFCTDDKHPAEIRDKGHIDQIVRLAVRLGVKPVTAVKMATLNPAELYGLKDFGAVAPGRRADLVLLRSLEGFEIDAVYKDGKLYTQNSPPTQTILFPALRQTVRLPLTTRQQLTLKPCSPFPVITLLDHRLETRLEWLNLPVNQDGSFIPTGDLLKIAVLQRHDGSGRAGVGVLKGFGLKNGAIASTVSHDSHNLIVAGNNDEDMLAAVEALRQCQGGYAIASGDTVQVLELPVAGLMNDDPAYRLEEQLEKMLNLARDSGVRKGFDPFLTLSFLALTVIPEVRITDRGIYDTSHQRFLTVSQQEVTHGASDSSQ